MSSPTTSTTACAAFWKKSASHAALWSTRIMALSQSNTPRASSGPAEFRLTVEVPTQPASEPGAAVGSSRLWIANSSGSTPAGLIRTTLEPILRTTGRSASRSRSGRS